MENKHPYFKDNPELNLKVIVTIHGYNEYAVNCKKLKDGYYVKGKDLFCVNEEWILLPAKHFDHELKIFVADDSNLYTGIVDVAEDGTETIGMFSINNYKHCVVKYSNGHVNRCMNYNLLNDKYYVENYAEGVFYKREGISQANLQKFSSKRLMLNNNGCVYNIMDEGSGVEIYKEFYEKSKIKVENHLKYLSTYIKDISFGAELETISGALPPHLAHQYGIITCKDGSTKSDGGYYPPEFVTVPYKGVKGIQSLRDISKEIGKRSDIDIKCSLHLHLGGFKIDRLFMVSMFKLCNKIQGDIFKMFPHYKTNEIKFAGKEKNYCKKLPNFLNHYQKGDFNKYINSSYEDIYTFLTGGKKFTKDLNIKNKVNPWGNHKWDILTRYYWVNFINPIFGKQDTIEFRLHTATLNPDKITNWLLICIAIIKFAQNNPKDCLNDKKVKIEDILAYYKDAKNTEYGQKLADNLLAYYNLRKKYFAEKLNQKDYIVLEDLINDNNFEFNVTKIL